MPSTSQNIARLDTYDARLAGVPIVPGQAINAGDIVCWDPALAAGNGGLRVVAAQADMNIASGGYIGCSDQQDPVASLGDFLNNLNVILGGVVNLKTTAGETYKMFDKVFFNETIDAQTIVKATNAGARTVGVGYIIIPPTYVMAGTTTLSGTAVANIWVSLTPFFVPCPK